MAALPFVPENLRGPVRLALFLVLFLVIVSTVFPWYEMTGSVRGSVRGIGSSSESSSATYVMWAGRPLFALLMFGSASAGIFFGFKGASGGAAAKLGIASVAAVALFAILGAIVVPAGASGSSSMGGVGSMSTKVEFALAWGGVFGVVLAVISLLLAVASFGGAFMSPKTSA